MADTIEYFESPSEHNVYKKGSFVHCSVNDMPDPHGHQVIANLYKEYSNGMPIYAVKTWLASSLDDEDKNEEFDAYLDPNLPPGRYFVQIDVEGQENKDRVRSRTFGVCQDNRVRFEQIDSPYCK
ncbi:hypothetical protein LRAMOSA06056 [Lichtheimia ramosa]|uniref:Uncharacterized protein n=1 Tax=Lichtheimia ramosa TaxID=688394 RepID=A0A077X4D4_9FUNG|nr:hypothetical protein LRAMOSA06056 [Lichtheimia ramosa]